MSTIYVTREIILENVDDKQIVSITNDSGYVTEAEYTKIDRIVAAVNDLVDNYLRDRYAVPITGSIPDLLKEIAFDIAVYKLYKGRLLTSIPEGLTKTYETNIALLDKISNGKIVLDIPENDPSATAGDILVTERTKVFPSSVLDTDTIF